MTANEIIKQYADSIADVVDIEVVYGSKDDVLLRGSLRSPFQNPKSAILDRIGVLPGRSEIISIEPNVVLRIQLPGTVTRPRVPWLNIILFLLTVITTTAAGALNAGVDFFLHPGLFLREPSLIIKSGLPFSLSLLGILLCHEFGHYTASRWHGVKVSLPYFVPFPSPIGTMGAIIRTKSPFITRQQLFDVGAAGPLAGMAVAIPLVAWGLAHPVVIPLPEDTTGMLFLGESLLFKFIGAIFQPAVPEGQIVTLNPVAFAGWVGLFVTMLNLLPMGQLDGGHILYAMFGRIQHRIAYVALLGLIVLSFLWFGWVIWAFLGMFVMKAAHPPTILDDIPISKGRKIVGYVCLAVFLLCFMPTPVS